MLNPNFKVICYIRHMYFLGWFDYSSTTSWSPFPDKGRLFWGGDPLISKKALV